AGSYAPGMTEVAQLRKAQIRRKKHAHAEQDEGKPGRAAQQAVEQQKKVVELFHGTPAILSSDLTPTSRDNTPTPHMKKTYISAAQLLRDSFELALLVLHSGWLPTIVVGVWRGGTPVGIAVQEALAFAGCKTTHMPIRVTSYIGIGSRGKIEVEGLE